jgi:hypothetical protein
MATKVAPRKITRFAGKALEEKVEEGQTRILLR